MPLYELKGQSPSLKSNCWVAPSAEVIGDVEAGEGTSFWFNVTVRGDVMPIRIGSNTNVQDGSTLHGTLGRCGLTIGDRVTIGHNVVLHGCTIEDECLIGMGSVVMDLSVIPRGSVVGAGSLVTEGSTFEPGMLILGRPAKAVRPLNEKEKVFLKQSAQNYIDYANWYRDAKIGEIL